MKKLPGFLEYFLEDILGKNNGFTVRKMFGAYGIFKNRKIFALYVNDEIYFRKNTFIKDNEQFFYLKKGEKIFLPYFKVDENILENREKIENFIEKSLDY